jgi:hypothetical protein
MARTDGLGKSNSVSSACRAFGGSSVDGPAFDRCLNALTPALLSGEVRISRGTRVQVEPRDRLLMHLFQHQIHHRGQAHAMLSGTRIKPPQLDEFFSIAEAPLRASELPFSVGRKKPCGGPTLSSEVAFPVNNRP